MLTLARAREGISLCGWDRDGGAGAAPSRCRDAVVGAMPTRGLSKTEPDGGIESGTGARDVRAQYTRFVRSGAPTEDKARESAEQDAAQLFDCEARFERAPAVPE